MSGTYCHDMNGYFLLYSQNRDISNAQSHRLHSVQVGKHKQMPKPNIQVLVVP